MISSIGNNKYFVLEAMTNEYGYRFCYNKVLQISHETAEDANKINFTLEQVCDFRYIDRPLCTGPTEYVYNNYILDIDPSVNLSKSSTSDFTYGAMAYGAWAYGVAGITSDEFSIDENMNVRIKKQKFIHRSTGEIVPIYIKNFNKQTTSKDYKSVFMFISIDSFDSDYIYGKAKTVHYDFFRPTKYEAEPTKISEVSMPIYLYDYATENFILI